MRKDPYCVWSEDSNLIYHYWKNQSNAFATNFNKDIKDNTSSSLLAGIENKDSELLKYSLENGLSLHHPYSLFHKPPILALIAIDNFKWLCSKINLEDYEQYNQRQEGFMANLLIYDRINGFEKYKHLIQIGYSKNPTLNHNQVTYLGERLSLLPRFLQDKVFPASDYLVPDHTGKSLLDYLYANNNVQYNLLFSLAQDYQCNIFQKPIHFLHILSYLSINFISNHSKAFDLLEELLGKYHNSSIQKAMSLILVPNDFLGTTFSKAVSSQIKEYLQTKYQIYELKPSSLNHKKNFKVIL